MDKDLLAKTLDTSSTNGNNVLNPVLLSRIIVEQARRQPTLRNALPREPFKGKTYLWDIKTSVGDAVTAADGATLPIIDAAYAQGSVEMSYFYYVAQITNPAIVAASELVDLLEDRMNDAVRAIMRKEGSFLYNGDALGAPKSSGINSQILAGGRVFGGGAGQSLVPSLLDNMELSLTSDGYSMDELAYVMSPRMATAVKAFAFNHFRANNINGAASFGFDFRNGMYWNGIPVLVDPYAGSNVGPIANETLSGAASGTTFTFANPNVIQQSSSSGTDYAGTAEIAPVIKVGGTTQAANTYTLSANASGGTTVVFNSAPGSAPTASYYWKQENIYLLSLNKSDIVIPVSLEMTVDNNILAPATVDLVPIRVKQYSSVVVKNPRAHAIATNILAPSSTVGF